MEENKVFIKIIKNSISKEFKRILYFLILFVVIIVPSYLLSKIIVFQELFLFFNSILLLFSFIMFFEFYKTYDIIGEIIITNSQVKIDTINTPLLVSICEIDRIYLIGGIVKGDSHIMTAFTKSLRYYEGSENILGFRIMGVTYEFNILIKDRNELNNINRIINIINKDSKNENE